MRISSPTSDFTAIKSDGMQNNITVKVPGSVDILMHAL
jgi:hypothetical protein